MNETRKRETAMVVATLTAVAALAASLMGTKTASAAPTGNKVKRSTVRVVHSTRKKPIYVKMVGNRRAAENFAEQAYANLLAQERQAQQQRQQQQEQTIEAYGSALTMYGDGTTTAASSSLPPAPVVVPVVPYTIPGAVVAPQNVVVTPYGYSNQTITIPGNIYGGAPSINTYGASPYYNYPGNGFFNGYGGYTSGYGVYGGP